MAELNLKQITDKLNAEFSGSVRKLVFWYDANAEFKEDVDTLELTNAQVLHLEADNQFYIKYFLECEDKENNYLVYAPFAKPAIKENHLADTIRYSKEFFADRASLLALDLGIDERFKPVIQHYIKFFASKARTQAFYDLEIETFNRSTIEVALMSVLCKSKTSAFEEVLRCILTDDGFLDNKYLAEFEKYDLLDAFWQQADSVFGYQDSKPTLEKFTITMFVTYIAKTIHTDVPQPWKSFVSYKSGNIIAFIDNLMNSYLYGERFDEISADIYNALNGKTVFSKMAAEDIVDCSVFAGIDDLIIKWITERLENEDTGAKLGNKTIPEICKERRQKHFGSHSRSEYFVLENAWHLLSTGVYEPFSGLNSVLNYYVKGGYLNDRRYRYFYYYFDQIEDTTKFERLRELVENVYTNEYLNKVSVNWNKEFATEQANSAITKQTDFFSKYIRYSKERTVVIISDALRYEVGQSLFEKLQADEKCSASIVPMQSVLPSYTRFGMAALLPHRTLELSDSYQVLVDGKSCEDLKQREAILREHKANSKCVQYDDIKKMKVAELREVFTGQDVVYIYHNQIDARGDKLNTENEVFIACEEAIEEIYALIKRLSTSANTVHFIVTADHGFIYKRDKLTESDKISNVASQAGTHAGKRYCIAEQSATAEGVASLPLNAVLNNGDERIVTFPIGSDIFKVAGGGMNYVHGGSSPQEMIVPVIDIKTEKGRKETTTAQIALVSLTNKITNLITTLDFVQTEAVSDVVKETTYRIYFISADGEKISNENLYVADKKDAETVKRVFRLRFSFKNKQYNKSQRYYLVAFDDKNDIEVLRHEIVMDIAFADDFGFFG